MKKLFVLFLVSFSFVACATSQKEAKETPRETGFVMSQEELEEFFPTLDPAETGHCNRCGIVNNYYNK